MRHLIETCLTGCEWIEERRGQASAWMTARDSEKRAILTFLSQGAVGGAVASFLLTVFAVVFHPNGYNFLLLVFLPAILVYGSALGAITAVFIWLPLVLSKRRLRFTACAVIGITAMTLLAVALSYLTEEPAADQLFYLWLLGFSCAIGLPVALMTGSRIRPCRMIVFGAGRRAARHNFGSLLSIPVGFLLRAASIFGLLEALMVLAFGVSAGRGDWLDFPAQEHLPAIVFAVFYFATSAYFSFRSPRKILLLTTAIILNLPMAAWIGSLRRVGTEESNYLAYLLLGFMCLWTVYTFSRLLAPESAMKVVNSAREPAEVCRVSQCGDYSVQL